MPNKSISFRLLVRKLEKLGFEVKSQKGSHIKYIKITSEGIITVIVPRHTEIAAGTLKSILAQAMIDFETFNSI